MPEGHAELEDDALPEDQHDDEVEQEQTDGQKGPSDSEESDGD